jgi:hypothetical protein
MANLTESCGVAQSLFIWLVGPFVGWSQLLLHLTGSHLFTLKMQAVRSSESSGTNLNCVKSDREKNAVCHSLGLMFIIEKFVYTIFWPKCAI